MGTAVSRAGTVMQTAGIQCSVQSRVQTTTSQTEPCCCQKHASMVFRAACSDAAAPRPVTGSAGVVSPLAPASAASLWVQVRISHAGQGKMLLNNQALPGANKRALSLAERQMKESKPDTPAPPASSSSSSSSSSS